MPKNIKRHSDNQRFAKCEICLSHIPIQYYFNIQDTIICYQCKTEYVLKSKDPIQLEIVNKTISLDGTFIDNDYE